MSVNVIITTRAVMIGDEVAEAGDRVKVDPLVAGDLIDCGRARLVDPDEMGIITIARRAEIQRVMRNAGPLAPHPGSPWISARGRY